MRASRTWLGRLGLICWAVAAATPADAAGSAVCALSTTSLVFGQYVPSRGGSSDFTATVYVSCTTSGTSSAIVEGTLGLIGPGTPAGRELVAGSHRLRYQLYLDPARTIPWGDGSGGTRTKAISVAVGSAASAREAHTIYGRIRARQSNVAVGHYTGQITAVLNY